MDVRWKRLATQLEQTFDALADLEGAVEQGGKKGERELVEAVRSQAESAARMLRERSEGPNDWKAWVEAETAWLETRSALNGLVAEPGLLRDAYLASVRRRAERAEVEISGLLARRDLFRPRTRLAISKEADRLRRMLDVLREEAGRLGQSGTRLDELSALGVGQVWCDVAWAVEETKARFARPRGRFAVSSL